MLLKRKEKMAQVSKSGSTLVAVIGDEDTVTGFLLAGVGERNSKGEANFFIVDDRKSTLETDIWFGSLIERYQG